MTNSLAIKLEKSYEIGLKLVYDDRGGILDPEYPSHPPWHLIIRNLISTCENLESNDNRSEFERIVKVRTNNTDGPEEQTHTSVPNDDE